MQPSLAGYAVVIGMCEWGLGEMRVVYRAGLFIRPHLLPTFLPRYQSLLVQYAAVSYGDPLFSSYLLLPLQQCFPVSLRRTVWNQHSHTLRLLSLPLDQVRDLTLNSQCLLFNEVIKTHNTGAPHCSRRYDFICVCVQLPVGLDSFLSPPETDHELLDLYMGALATGCVQ